MTHKKPALIFIHGFRGSPDGIKEIAMHFADYQIFTPEIPPLKNTLKVYDLEHYTTFLSNYITKNKISQPILVGHSMGSIIAASTAAKHPDLVNQKLILMSPISSKIIKPIARLEGLITILPSHFISWLTTWFLFAANRYKNPGLYQKALKMTNLAANQYHNKTALANSAIFSASHKIGEFDLSKQAVCLIAGAKDRIVSQKATKKLAKQIHAKLYFIPQSGHLINYERPNKVAKIIRDFLNQ